MNAESGRFDGVPDNLQSPSPENKRPYLAGKSVGGMIVS